MSIVEYRPSLLGYLLVCLAILIFGFLALILLPFLVGLTKISMHRCGKCLNEVKENTYFGLSSMEDKVSFFIFNNPSLAVEFTNRVIWYYLDEKISSVRSHGNCSSSGDLHIHSG
jgi:hypothetical protein